MHYVLDSIKSEKGRLDIVRKVNDNVMTMMIQWYPSSEDDTIYISHHRLYTRRGPQVNLADITQKAQIRLLMENMRDSPINTTLGVATDASKMAASVPLTFASSLSSRFRKGSHASPLDDPTTRAAFTKNAKQTNSDPTPTAESVPDLPPSEQPREIPPPLDTKSSLAPRAAVYSDPLWRSLAVPVGAFVLSMILFIIFIKFGSRST